MGTMNLEEFKKKYMININANNIRHNTIQEGLAELTKILLNP